MFKSSHGTHIKFFERGRGLGSPALFASWRYSRPLQPRRGLNRPRAGCFCGQAPQMIALYDGEYSYPSSAGSWRKSFAVPLFFEKEPLLVSPARFGFLPNRKGNREQSGHTQNRTSLACPQQQSRHFARIACKGVICQG